MRVLIVGAGAIGILMGHRLERAGHEVTFLGRPAVRDAAARNGLRVIDQAGAHYLSSLVVTDVGQLSHAPHIIIITVKAHDTAGAAAQIAPLASDHTPILLIQNGVGGEEAGVEMLPSSPWFGAVTTLVADRLESTLVQQSKAKASLVMAPICNVEDTAQMSRLFEGTGFDTVRVCPSHDAMKWSKLLLNILGNAVPAIVDMSPAATFANTELFAVERAAYLETLAVMQARDIKPIPLPGYPVPMLVWAMRRLPAGIARTMLARLIVGGRGGKMPSLHKDLTSRRTKSEVQFLNGGIATSGEKAGVPAPVNQALTDILLSIAAGDVPWDRYRGDPHALWVDCGMP